MLLYYIKLLYAELNSRYNNINLNNTNFLEFTKNTYRTFFTATIAKRYMIVKNILYYFIDTLHAKITCATRHKAFIAIRLLTLRHAIQTANL